MDIGSIKPQVVAFIDSHELAVVKQALKAMRNAVDLRHEIGLPCWLRPGKQSLSWKAKSPL